MKNLLLVLISNVFPRRQSIASPCRKIHRAPVVHKLDLPLWYFNGVATMDRHNPTAVWTLTKQSFVARMNLGHRVLQHEKVFRVTRRFF